MHLSHLAPVVMKDLLGPIDFVIVELTELKPDGRHPSVFPSWSDAAGAGSEDLRVESSLEAE